MARDVINFVFTIPLLWPVSGSAQIRNIFLRVSGIKQAASVGLVREKQSRRKRLHARIYVRSLWRRVPNDCRTKIRAGLPAF
jgi:hypothetical protein